MITDGTGIILHVIHQTDFNLSLKQIIKRSSLREVTCIKQQQVFVFLTFLLQESCTTGHSGLASQQSISKRVRERLHTTMHIVGVINIQ